MAKKTNPTKILKTPEKSKHSESNLVPRSSIQLVDAKGELMLPENIISLLDDGDEVEFEPVKVENENLGDLYTSFVRHATNIPRLSEDEEHALGLKIKNNNDDKAAKKLVLHNLRLAIKMAHQYRRAWTNLMDLVQEAAAGMSIAAKRWDPEMETRFGTYAAYWIRAQLTKFLITNGRLIHTGNTRAGRKVYFSLPQIRRKLLAAGKEPTVDLIAAEVGEDPKEVALILSRLEGKETSLSTPLSENSAESLQDVLESPDANPETLNSKRQIKQLVHELVIQFEKSLTNERDLVVWQEHLMSPEPLSLVELGSRYGVSKQRMGQLATRLKRSFRRHVIDTLGPHSQLSWLFDK